MDNKNHLVFFLNSVKDELSFLDYDDFYNKIRNNFDFRIKVQKFVFIAKFFGWNHSYSFNMHFRCPYSKVLENDYYNMNLFSFEPSNIISFDLSSFKNIIQDKSIYYLESFSSILYYKNENSSLSINDVIHKLNKSKPYIPTEIVRNACDDLSSLNFYFDNPISDNTIDSLDNMKNNLLKEINDYIDIFKDFGENDNGLFIAGSLDYIRIVLDNIEDLTFAMKKDLLEFIEDYVSNVEKIYLFSDKDEKIFDNLNLNSLENLFDRLQNFISKDLEILPILDDDEFDIYLQC